MVKSSPSIRFLKFFEFFCVSRGIVLDVYSVLAGNLAYGENSLTLRLTSELVDLRAANANPYSRPWREGVRICPPKE